jgi:hypothetical protein
MALDLPNNTYNASGAFNLYAAPTANHLVLLEEELNQMFSLYKGSGGEVASLLSASLSGANTYVYTAPKNKLKTALNEICLAFGLTKDELSQICNVQSRKTLYNWVNGEAKPRRSAMNKIFDLLVIARAWRSSGFSADREHLYQPVLDDQSVFHLLIQTQIDKERILFAGSRLNLKSPAKNELLDPFD